MYLAFFLKAPSLDLIFAFRCENICLKNEHHKD